MTDRPLVSFVVPIYQQAPLIGRTLSGVLGQTVTDLEVIVVDDGSTDGGAEIAAAIRDPRLRLLRQTNQGPSSALNVGLQAARGRYVMLVGGDDVSLPDRVRLQIELIEDVGADIVFSLPILIDEEDRQLDPSVFPVFFGQSLAEFHSAPLRSFFLHGNFLCASSVCFRRSLFERIGGFATGLIQLQDFDYWVRVAKQGLNFRVSTEPVVQYRRRLSGNLSSSRNDARTRLELRYILRGIFDECDSAAMNSILRRDLTFETGLDQYGVELTAIVAYLSHSRRDVREIGYHRAIALLNAGPTAQREAARVGLTPAALFDVIGIDAT